MSTYHPAGYEAFLGFSYLKPVPLWSGRMALDCEMSEFRDAAIEVSREGGQLLTGFVESKEGKLTSFTRTRYPRPRYGIPSLAECTIGMDALAEKLGTLWHTEDEQRGVRVVLGLIEGYDPASPVHTASEIAERLPSLTITPAEVFAVRNAETALIYTEPVAVLNFSTLFLRSVFSLADRFKQERFTVEDFNKKQSYVVETSHCTEPSAPHALLLP